jgi:hypothetical protein
MMNSSMDEEDFGLPTDDPAAFLDRLEAEPGEELPNGLPTSLPPLSREEIEELVNLVLDEELERLEEGGRQP